MAGHVKKFGALISLQRLTPPNCNRFAPRQHPFRTSRVSHGRLSKTGGQALGTAAKIDLTVELVCCSKLGYNDVMLIPTLGLCYRRRRIPQSLSAMQSVASLEIDAARVLFERLKRKGISADLRTTTAESGLDIGDIMVEDEQYDRACEVAETWHAELREEAEKKSRRCCPKCESCHFDYAPREPVGPIWKCRDCGCEVVFKSERV